MTAGDGSEDTVEAIMEATYRALCTHGYPATSISKIADEFAKSKSLLYYHYEDKEDLLEDFLQYLLDRFEAELTAIETEEPTARLHAVLDRLIPTDLDTDGLRFRRALLEIRSQAPYHDAYHEQFERSDELVLETLVDTIEAGIEDGSFRAVNSQETAEFLYSTAYGAIERGVTLEDMSILERGRTSIDAYIETQLVRYA